nr:MAG TPA: hypothetical protein [Caudoviricetes sp.]
MEGERVHNRHHHDIPLRGLVFEHTSFQRNTKRGQCRLNVRKYTHSLLTSSSNFCCIAAIHADLDADLAGFKKGFAGWPCFPYSRMLAIMALLLPSERGSAKPILMLWLPCLSTLTGVTPREASNSPVDSDGCFVPLPTTADRLLLTFARTTSPPASSTFSATASVLDCSLENFNRKSSGIFTSTFAIGRHAPFRQHLHIHPMAFDILHRGNVIATAIAHQNVVSGDRQPRDTAEAEKVGRLRKCSEVCPSLGAVAPLPVNTDRSENFIHRGRKALAVLDMPGFDDIRKTVHHSITHTHTFHSRSRRRSKFTVSHTCFPAWTLSAKKPPVLPSLDS